MNAAARQRLSRGIAACACLVLLGTFAPPRLFSALPVLGEAIIHFEPLPLDERAPAQRRAGKLLFLGGWELTSANARFGGISALHVSGNRVLGLSDSGLLIQFPLPRRGDRVEGSIRTLGDGPGSPDIKEDRDTESLIVDGNRAWIGFERRNAVWRYDSRTWKSDSHAAPPAMHDWPENTGAEGMLRLPDGRFLVFSEATHVTEDQLEVLLFDGDPAVPGTRSVRMGYRAPPGFHLTDAALLADGRLLLLNRRFTVLEGVSAKLVLAPMPRLQAGSVIQGEEILELRPPLLVDNMEGLSVTSEQGRTIVWIVSDDNYNPLQRTLLIKFALPH